MANQGGLGAAANDFQNNDVEPAEAAEQDDFGDNGKDASKSSGLKRIAKQVIDIIQTRPFMSYPQVAYFVV